MCFLSVYKLKLTLFSKLIYTLKAIINHTDSQTDTDNHTTLKSSKISF